MRSNEREKDGMERNVERGEQHDLDDHWMDSSPEPHEKQMESVFVHREGEG